MPDVARVVCRPGVEVHDLVRIDAFGGDADCFGNAWHYTRENGRRMLESMVSTPGLCGWCARSLIYEP